MVSGTSNEKSFNPLKRADISINLASGLASAKTKVCDGITGSRALYNLLFRNFDATNARSINVWIGTNNTANENNKVQISIPANAGNNGVVSLASLVALCPQLFSVTDLAGNYFKILEDSTYSVWVEHLVTLTAAMSVTAVVGDMA